MISRGQEAAKVGLSSSIRCSAEQVCLCNLGYPTNFHFGLTQKLNQACLFHDEVHGPEAPWALRERWVLRKMGRTRASS